MKINDSDRTDYMELLLIADEQVSMIETYLYRDDMFTLRDDDIRAICVITQEQPGLLNLRILLRA